MTRRVNYTKPLYNMQCFYGLLTRFFMFYLQGRGHIVDTWRMLHSVAGQIEYVIELGRSLMDLTQYVLDHYTRGSRTLPGQQPATDDDQEELGMVGEKVVSVAYSKNRG